MKLSFITLGILSAILTWWWTGSRLNTRASRRSFGQRLIHSTVAGISVYFGLMAAAMLWLLAFH